MSNDLRGMNSEQCITWLRNGASMFPANDELPQGMKRAAEIIEAQLETIKSLGCDLQDARRAPPQIIHDMGQ